jgi:hypothetical protein
VFLYDRKFFFELAPNDAKMGRQKAFQAIELDAKYDLGDRWRIEVD